MAGGVKFNPAKDIPDLTGKHVFVTGGNSGLGAESVRQLAAKKATVYLAARTVSKADALVAEIKEKQPDAIITVLPLDLGSFDSIKACAAQFNSISQRLDLLLCNAGVAFDPPGLTQDGYELQFGTNHMGHALLTRLLLPTLLKTAAEQAPKPDVRIVFVASEAGELFSPKSGIDLASARSPMDQHKTWHRYGMSKLANIQFAFELSRRYPELRVVAIHPGRVQTPLINGGFTKSHAILSRLLMPLQMIFFGPPSEGAKNQLWASTSWDARTGGYYDPVGKVAKQHKLANDTVATGKLWDYTESELVERGAEKWPEAEVKALL